VWWVWGVCVGVWVCVWCVGVCVCVCGVDASEAPVLVVEVWVTGSEVAAPPPSERDTPPRCVRAAAEEEEKGEKNAGVRGVSIAVFGCPGVV
jgi:hypothetical protein